MIETKMYEGCTLRMEMVNSKIHMTFKCTGKADYTLILSKGEYKDMLVKMNLMVDLENI
jgi:hypothetical protein